MKTVQKTKITTSLPYCLYKVDNRFFKLHDSYNSKIQFLKVETVPNRRTDSSKNVETIRDRWGIDAHSDVVIYTDKIFDEVKKAEEFALDIINNFIQRYRHFDKEAIHLVLLSPEDLFGFSVLTDGKGAAAFRLAGGITVTNPLLVHEISNNIENAIDNKEEIPLYNELLLNSRQYIYQREYRHAILESVIALELVISEFIKRKCAEKNISKEKAKDYVKDVGLTGNIDVTLKLLSNNALPSDDTIMKCKKGITMRNKIVHEGRKRVLISEARETLKNTEILIEWLIAQP